ncbi:MAG: DUF4364 family protein [Clostridia bacterium]|nr:DUF4364 family protein [Clostridia bacterium]
MNNVKIFVLYLMRNINYPLDYVTLNEIVMQTDYVMYLDFAVAFHEMLDGGLITEVEQNEQGEGLYAVTDRGRIVAEQLKSDILPSILEQSLGAALRYLDFKRRDIKIRSDAKAKADHTVDVTLTVTEAGRTLLSTTVNVDSERRAEMIRENFRDRPEIIYRGILALLSGKMDFLFDK